MDLKITKSTLKELGFDNKELNIYLALLKIGETTATKLSKDTKIERTLVYYIIEKLINRGLVAYKLKNNVKYYTAANPEKILQELKDKQSSFLKILPILNKIKADVYEDEVKVDIYKGLEGFKAVTNDIFKTAKEYFVFGEQGQFQKTNPVYCKQFIRRLNEHNIKENVIVREDFRNKIWKSKNAKYKYLPKDLLSPTTTLIYDNKVLITIWDKPLFNILITSKSIAKSYKAYFNHFWKIAKK